MRREERIDDPEESLRLALENAQSRLWTAMPGLVVSVNLLAQTLSVQPAIQGTVTSADGESQSVNLPLLVDVPIVWPRAGGFALTFPVAINDEVLVVFASRCIDSWWQSGQIGAQAEVRMHDLSDGFAILAPTSQPRRLGNVSATNAQLRDSAGTTFLELMPGGGMRLKSTSSLIIDSPNIAINGSVTQTGGMSIGGIVFGTHTHSDPQGGGVGPPANG